MEKSQRAVRPEALPPPRPGSLQLVVAVLLLCAAAALAGYLLWVGEPVRAANEVETRVLARAVPALAQPVEAAVTLARGWQRATITLHAGPHHVSIARGALGTRVDVAALAGMLEAARDAGSPLRRLHAQRHGGATLALPVPAHIETLAARRWLESLAEPLTDPALGPRVDEKTGAVRPPRAGKVLDVEATLDALDDAIFTSAVDVHAVFAERPARALPEGVTLPAAIDVGTELGSMRGMRDDDPTRTHNMRVVARALDGALILPGGDFDARVELEEPFALGQFRLGRVVDGRVDPIESAVTQVLRTMHQAFIEADIALLEEPWITEDERARVNLRLASPLKHPCALFLEVKDGSLLVALRGAAADAPLEPPP